MVRIRNDPIVRELNFTEEQIKEAQKVMSSPISRQQRTVRLKEILKGSSCCVCGSLPSIQIDYQLHEIRRIERYCSICIKSVYQRERAEQPQSKQELAALYGCTIGKIK